MNQNQKMILSISIITFIISFIISIVRPNVINSNFSKNASLLIYLTIGLIVFSLVKVYYIIFKSEKQDYKNVGLFQLLNSTLTLDKLNEFKDIIEKQQTITI
jgi:sensor histidine kinase YesM